ncbi:hypothetical protein BGZ51_001277 [Haplosporangium sp. Z 767]|nr:hypothetical protein BGZ51_001277 [Haplosporangium sp. Z 767]KAF9194824.1 hypothetical protein BGZ50_005704 [Haplosporangium sp. Z 11]
MSFPSVMASGAMNLRELELVEVAVDIEELQWLLDTFANMLERLTVIFDYFIIWDLFLGEAALHPRSPANISRFSLSLTQLDLKVELPDESIEIWHFALPYFSLTHLGLYDEDQDRLLEVVDPLYNATWPCMMHTSFQRFQFGNEVESIAVRQDATGKYYSQMDDIQDVFPNASRFKVNGIAILFLQDKNGKRHEPKRIAHYPDDIIQVIAAYGTSSSSPSSTPHHPAESLPSPPPSLVGSPSSLASSMSALTLAPKDSSSSFNSSQELALSTDSQSAQHAHLMNRILHMVQMLAEAKEREEEMLREQKEAKARDEETQRMLQQANDRLAVVQQRVDAILVQNYELHEYPIPRLFVILPEGVDPYELEENDDDRIQRDITAGTPRLMERVRNWDPWSLVHERFRLYFLCECGEHTKTDSVQEAASKDSTQSEYRVHLALHEGYELTRPTQFFEKYGSYLLGMLQILQHCLTVAKIVSPVAGHFQPDLKGLMEGTKAASESTLDAINISINFLENRLGTDNVSSAAGTDGSGSDSDVGLRLKNMDALEGADLRRLETFLRNKDQDKILGNLYRITTSEGHVKWVCLRHYKSSYHEIAMKRFLQTVEVNYGLYDPQFRKVTIMLTSSTAAKDFLQQLSSQAPVVDELDLTLNWDFNSSDLRRVVEALAQTNVKFLTLDLKDFQGVRLDIKLPGKGKYHALQDLLSNRTLRTLILKRLDYFSSRTSSLPRGQSPSMLRSLHYLSMIRSTDQSRVASIITHCPNLVDLRLGRGSYWSEMHSELSLAIGTLKRMEVLRLSNFWNESKKDIVGLFSGVAKSASKLRELVLLNVRYDKTELRHAVDIFADTLERLLIDSGTFPRSDFLAGSTVLRRRPSGDYSDVFSRLTQLDLNEHFSESIKVWYLVLPHLSLTYLELNGSYQSCLLNAVNFSTLRSISLVSMDFKSLSPLWQSFPEYGGSSQINTLSLNDITGFDDILPHLANISLKRLWLEEMGCIGYGHSPYAPNKSKLAPSHPLSSSSLSGTTTEPYWTDSLLKHLNLSRLEVLMLANCGYDKQSERILARRQDEFSERFMIHVGHYFEDSPESTLDSNFDSINMSSVSTIRRDDGALDPRRVKIYHAASYTQLYYQLIIED